MKILIIDDEPELVDALARFCPEIGITDLRLPDGDGFDVIKHVRGSSLQTRTILMTAYHAPGMEEASLRAGAAAYLRKPFSLAALKNAVEAVARTMNEPD